MKSISFSIVVFLSTGFAFSQDKTQKIDTTNLTSLKTKSTTVLEKKNQIDKSFTTHDFNKTKVNVLTAANFDFGSTVKSNFLAHVNIYKPIINSSMWGLNAGLMKIDYSSFQSTTELIVNENILIDPFKPLVSGTKYLKQINRMEFTVKNNVWSLYAQPMYRLTKNLNNKSVFYVNGHIELLINNWILSSNIQNLFQDTGTVDTSSVVARLGITTNNTRKYVRYNVFGGLGLTGDIDLDSSARLFFQTTLGITEANPELTSYQNSILSFNEINKYRPFALFRSYFSKPISSSSALTLGTEVRWVWGKNSSPMYAVYLGLAVKIDQLAELL